MEKEQLKPLKRRENAIEILEVYLSKETTPEAWERRMYELMHHAKMEEEEAIDLMKTTPIPLEVYYDVNLGLFGVEEETGGFIKFVNPYTGEDMMDEDISKEEEKTPEKRLDEILGELENINSDLREIWEKIDFSMIDSERLENARDLIDDALSNLHSIGDPED